MTLENRSTNTPASATDQNAEHQHSQSAAPVEGSQGCNAQAPDAEDRRSAEAGGRRSTDKPSGANTPADANIRVSVGVLDSLMNLAGELVLARNQLLQAVGSSDSGLNSVAARLDQVTSELQEAIMQTRMQAVGTVFSNFPRVVRDLSNQLGKQCQLLLEGEDVELDKSVIEAIGDPLTHLIRNAVDHGIESPDVRTKAGKPAMGTISLAGLPSGGQGEYRDQRRRGGHRRLRSLRKKPSLWGLIRPEQAANMSDREALRLIFHPGFSLAEKVTEVSGRGVGMDVVKTNIEKLGGAVGIDTELGRRHDHQRPPAAHPGHHSLLDRPLRRQPFRHSADQHQRIGAHQGRRSGHQDRAGKAGRSLPAARQAAAVGAARCGSRLGIKHGTTTGQSDAVHIIVVEAGHLQYGLVVDGLHDSEEIVVKPLGRHMQDCRCLAGATILGDGPWP